MHGVIEDSFSLTPMQAGLLVESLRADARDGVNVSQYVLLARGVLDIAALEAAWRDVVRRHDALRAAFDWDRGDDPRQIVYADPDIEWTAREVAQGEIDETLAAYLRADRARGFDVSMAPLLRIACFRTASDAACLVVTAHHLILDGWSKAIVVNEVCQAYEARLAGRPPHWAAAPSFRDYVDWLKRRDASDAEDYWSRTLAGLGTQPLSAHAMPNGAPSRFDEIDLPLSNTLWHAVVDASRRCHVTPNTFATAAWALVLARHLGSDDIVFGSINSGRDPELPDIERLVGLCINAMPLRVRIHGDPLLATFLRELQNDQADAREHDALPPSTWRRWLSSAHGAGLFDVLFVYENYPPHPTGHLASSLTITTLNAVERPNVPLTAVVVPGERFQIKCIFDANAFDGGVVRCLMRQYRTALESMVANPTASLSRVSILSPEEREDVVVRWNATDRPDEAIDVMTRILRQAAKGPERVAVASGASTVTYDALMARSHQLGHALRAWGVTPETRVAVMLERSVDWVISLLGILSAGAVYVPIDPAYPAERRAYMLADCGAHVLLTTDAALGGVVPPPTCRVVDVTAAAETIASQPVTRPATPTPAQLAYVLYTSGSTGRPKGVAVTHAGIMHAVTAQAALGVTEQDRIWQFASASFDASVYEVWLALTNGATLVLRAPGSMPEGGVTASLEAAQITVTLLPPTLLAVTGAVASRSVRLVMVGGEACPPTVWSAWARERALWNLYGPTEATVVATAWAGPTPNDGTAPPIGRPIANARTYVLDADGRPVPVGVPGELYIGGGGVARGYWRRPAATAAAFVPDPFSDSPGARLYRTGDRVRWRPDGALDFLERNDRQVKLHGIRIELGEIEAVIRRHAAVRACVVELRTIHGDARLVAYVVADGLQSTAALRQALSAWLPPALIPSAFVFMDALPLTPNGKIDRAALPLPDLERPAADTLSLPDGSIERAIADVWRSVLHVSDVPTDENFFDAGGDSLSLLKVYTQLKTVFDGVQVVDLFQHPTITSLAAALAENQSASASA